MARVAVIVAPVVVDLEVGGPDEVGRAAIVGLAQIGTAADTGADVGTTRSDDSHPGGGHRGLLAHSHCADSPRRQNAEYEYEYEETELRAVSW